MPDVPQQLWPRSPSGSSRGSGAALGLHVSSYDRPQGPEEAVGRTALSWPAEPSHSGHLPVAACLIEPLLSASLQFHAVDPSAHSTAGASRHNVLARHGPEATL